MKSVVTEEHPESAVLYEEVTILSGGSPIVLSLWKSENAEKCIVFLPGTATHPLFYEQFLQALAENGFNVVGVHPVCHGKSPRIHRMLFSFQDIVQNGKDAVTYALEHLNNHVIVMGSSQGGIVAIALAGQDERIQAVFPHNILIPQVPQSITVTRFPNYLQGIYRLLVKGITIFAKLFPRLPIPVSLYLNLEKVSRNKQIIQQFYDDPIGFMSYPLHFLSSLFNADLRLIQDGSIKCPVVVIAAKGDPLFPETYTRTIYNMIQAPYKELLLLDEDVHLIFNERVNQVLQTVLAKLRYF